MVELDQAAEPASDVKGNVDDSDVISHFSAEENDHLCEHGSYVSWQLLHVPKHFAKRNMEKAPIQYLNDRLQGIESILTSKDEYTHTHLEMIPVLNVARSVDILLLEFKCTGFLCDSIGGV